MAISQVRINDYLAFKGEFAADFCPGVNVLIGGNGTGKTTLLREMYKNIKEKIRNLIQPALFDDDEKEDEIDVVIDNNAITHAVYFPEKDILEHARGLLPFIEQKSTGFSQIYKDVLVNAQDIPTNNQTETQKKIGEKIVDIIGGVVQWEQSEGTFYTVRTDGLRIPFAHEASGFKKLGYLGLLVASGQLANGTILFLDESENSLNPNQIPVFVDILLELARNGVQIFITTHGYFMARYFDVRKDKDIPVMYHNLSRTEDCRVTCECSPEYVKLPDNLLEKASEDMFEAVVSNAMGIQYDD